MRFKIGQCCEKGGGNWTGINSLRTGCSPMDCDTAQDMRSATYVSHKNVDSIFRVATSQNSDKTETCEVILIFYQLFITRVLYRVVVLKKSDKTRDMEH
jgi:hypothetical protein